MEKLGSPAKRISIPTGDVEERRSRRRPRKRWRAGYDSIFHSELY